MNDTYPPTDPNSEKMTQLRSGEWLTGFDPEFACALDRCADQCFEFNAIAPSRRESRRRLLDSILASLGENATINPPFRCDFGFNIRIGRNFVGNFNLTILDEACVTIGDNVFIGPNVTIATITHHLDAGKRNSGIMRALPVTIADNVWIASDVTILPGVTIGEGAVIGAGSVVTRDVMPFTVAAGNPCRPLKNIPQ